MDDIRLRRLEQIARIGEGFVKGKALPIGTIRTHGGKKVIKTAQGWRPHAEGRSGAIDVLPQDAYLKPAIEKLLKDRRRKNFSWNEINHAMGKKVSENEANRVRVYMWKLRGSSRDNITRKDQNFQQIADEIYGEHPSEKSAKASTKLPKVYQSIINGHKASALAILRFIDNDISSQAMENVFHQVGRKIMGSEYDPVYIGMEFVDPLKGKNDDPVGLSKLLAAVTDQHDFDVHAPSDEAYEKYSDLAGDEYDRLVKPVIKQVRARLNNM